jgi:hypothetical protein
MAITQHTELCPHCGEQPITLIRDETKTGQRPGVRYYPAPGDMDHLIACEAAALADDPVEDPTPPAQE